ncbi:MAG: SURF1 family protein [Hyphomicrobium sp.]
MLKIVLHHHLFWLSISFLILFFCLLKLGCWQLERKVWKEGLLQQISSRTHEKPRDLESFLKEKKTSEKNTSEVDLEYFPIKTQGRFLQSKEIYFYAPDQNLGSGYHVYTPFQIKGTDKILIVNRGFVPEQKKDPKSRGETLDQNEVEIGGLLRMPGRQALFVPNNDLKKNLWFWRDLKGMLQFSFGENLPPHYPFYLDIFKQENEGWPLGGGTLLNLPNRHFEYALTWFGLAFALFIIYSLYVISHFRHKTV